MNLRLPIHFYINPETERPHVEDHDISESEVRQVLRNAEQDYESRDDTRTCAGQTTAGRFLRVIYREDERSEAILIITAYDVTPKTKRAMRRRRRRRRP